MRFTGLGREEKEVARKCVVKVVLSREQKRILCELARRLGVSESEMMRTTLMDYAKDLQVVLESVHREKFRMIEA
jgi:hypothetical protein